MWVINTLVWGFGRVGGLTTWVGGQDINHDLSPLRVLILPLLGCWVPSFGLAVLGVWLLTVDAQSARLVCGGYGLSMKGLLLTSLFWDPILQSSPWLPQLASQSWTLQWVLLDTHAHLLPTFQSCIEAPYTTLSSYSFVKTLRIKKKQTNKQKSRISCKYIRRILSSKVSKMGDLSFCCSLGDDSVPSGRPCWWSTAKIIYSNQLAQPHPVSGNMKRSGWGSFPVLDHLLCFHYPPIHQYFSVRCAV